jgi:hypothetical protein
MTRLYHWNNVMYHWNNVMVGSQYRSRRVPDVFHRDVYVFLGIPRV